MQDYKEPISRVQKRHQIRRLFTIMGAMILTFAIFVGGVMVGVRLEKERVRISQGATDRIAISGEKGGADKGEKGKTPPTSDIKKEEETRFTFYETLTKKESPERKPGGVQEREAEKGVTPRSKEQVKEVTRVPAKRDIYFIQVGSFREKEKADGLRERLVAKGYKAHVAPVEIETVIWYRVRIGGYESVEEAQAIKGRVVVEEHLEGARVVPGS